MTERTENLRRRFIELYGREPAGVVSAPGRVNLIGEHIDYSGGHVLPMALDCAIEVAATLRDDGKFRLYSVQFGKLFEGPIPPAKTKDFFWTNYLFGVIHEFIKLGHDVRGLDAVIDGDIPRASGLSSRT